MQVQLDIREAVAFAFNSDVAGDAFAQSLRHAIDGASLSSLNSALAQVKADEGLSIGVCYLWKGEDGEGCRPHEINDAMLLFQRNDADNPRKFLEVKVAVRIEDGRVRWLDASKYKGFCRDFVHAVPVPAQRPNPSPAMRAIAADASRILWASLAPHPAAAVRLGYVGQSIQAGNGEVE